MSNNLINFHVTARPNFSATQILTAVLSRLANYVKKLKKLNFD